MKPVFNTLLTLAGAFSLACVFAQTPAPILDKAVDAEGKPIPFGVQPYKSPETPLGTGPYKAVMGTDPTLPAHVMYYPADLGGAGMLPIIAWGNGACVNAGNRFRYFLTEIASHGYLVIASGAMAPVTKEVGPQENPAIMKPGDKAPAIPLPLPTSAAQLTESIDWAFNENTREGSKFRGRLDTSKVAVAGQSCGGMQALSVAADPRITTQAIFNSGVFRFPILEPTPPDPRQVLAKLHGPVIFLTGEEAQEIAFPVATEDFQIIDHVPAFFAWKTGLTHIGTYGQPNGGELGKLAVDWFNWQLKGDSNAAKTFRGAECRLCTDSTWHVQKKKID